MKIPFYQVDAFTSEVFKGNPAGVCLLDEWLDDSVLQGIGTENNLSETAFLVRNAIGFDLRWFTPAVEVALCGHATLGSAYVLFNYLNWAAPTVTFVTRRSGQRVVGRRGDLLEMDFPARPPAPRGAPAGLAEALGARPVAVMGSEEDLLVVLASERAVAELTPDIAGLAKIESRGIIVTAKGEECDFVSRFFAPVVGVAEDPVTGSAHCVLVPYWAGILGKQDLYARQISRRGGELFCRNRGARVTIAGRAVLYLEGTLYL